MTCHLSGAHARAHGAYARHPVPPPGPPGEVHGTAAQDRPAPSADQAVRRPIATPLPVLAIGDTQAAPAPRRRWRLGAAIALASVAAIALATLARHLPTPTRPHVATAQAVR